MSYFKYIFSDDIESSERSGPGLEKVSFYILLVFVFLLPLIIAPLIAFEFTKSFFVISVSVLLFIIFLLNILKEGRFDFPNKIIFWPIVLVPLVFLLSSFFSLSFTKSFMGVGYETSTFIFVLVSFLLLFLITRFINTKIQIFYVYLVFFLSVLILSVFHLSRFVFGVDFLSFGDTFGSITSNTVGRWADLGIFFGTAVILSLMTLEELKFPRLMRVIILVTLILSVIMLATINVPLIWYFLSIFSLIYFVLSFSKANNKNSAVSLKVTSETSEDSNENNQVKKTPSRKFSVSSLVVLIFSVLFIFGGNFLSEEINNYYQITDLGAKPDFTTTLNIINETVSEKPVLGVGPNRFVNQWVIYKPDPVNRTIFWNVDFNHGFSNILTFVVTTGVLGILAWLLFFVLFIYLGFIFFFRLRVDKFSRYLGSSSFVTSLFLWVMNIMTIPGAVIWTLTFVFTGIFISVLLLNNFAPSRELLIYNGENKKLEFVNVAIIVLFIIASLALVYYASQKAISYVYFQRAEVAVVENNFPQAQKMLTEAIQRNPADLYFRRLSQLYLSRANVIVRQAQGQEFTEEENDQLVALLSAAIASAQNAVTKDRSNYGNYVNLGVVYRQALVLGVTGSYEEAIKTFEIAKELNPKSPAIYLQIARTEIANNDLEKARENIARARDLKPNYTQAIFLLARIEISEGNIESAIQQARQALQTAPRNPIVHFELGLLYFNDGQYQQAVEAFERTLDLAPTYSNANYFLGLSYFQLGRIEESVQRFDVLIETVPGNEFLIRIRENIRAGRDALDGLSGNIFDDNLEPDDSLPLDEEGEDLSEPEEEE